LRRHTVGIVGLGPVGSILAVYLARSGVAVYVMDASPERREQVNTNGISIDGYAELEVGPRPCFASVAEMAQISDLSILFICTKTWALPAVMEELASTQWPDSMRVVAAMNGIGPEDYVGERFAKDRVCRAVLNFAGNRKPDGQMTMNWFHPPNLLGPATERVANHMDEIAELLTAAGLTTHSVSHHEIKRAAFFKTILNSALNAMCAAHGLTMARAMHLPHTRRIARILLREGLAVAAMVGYNFGEDALERCIEYLLGGGDHYPSMWFDLKNRLPTEIEYINGKIVKIGRMFTGVDVSHNLYFTSAIITQEIKNQTRDDTDIPNYLING